jgi:cytochrome c oxidase assembly factor CtaG
MTRERPAWLPILPGAQLWAATDVLGDELAERRPARRWPWGRVVLLALGVVAVLAVSAVGAVWLGATAAYRA